MCSFVCGTMSDASDVAFASYTPLSDILCVGQNYELLFKLHTAWYISLFIGILQKQSSYLGRAVLPEQQFLMKNFSKPTEDSFLSPQFCKKGLAKNGLFPHRFPSYMVAGPVLEGMKQ